ncbi:MAG: peptidase M75 [Bacteroidales bacterium]|nr:peptidase M75 [Bacteroidales bacterium]
MKKNFKTLALVAAASCTLGFVACSDKTVETDADDAKAAEVAAQFVDHTVAPTYTALAAKAETLASALASLKETPTDAGIKDACDLFLAAREQWERSEAFLFGAAGDFGVDPHIDSWPLDLTAFNTLMNNSDMLGLLDGEDGDVQAGELLSNALLGFHGLEYILFENGQPKTKDQISATQWIYVAAVAGDLRNRCFQLEVGWLGDAAPKSHIDKLEDIEMQYTVAGGDFSYGENMKNAGKAGSTYVSRLAALIAIVQGCADIADEVGSSKINSAYALGDETYIESPYSHMSITDFHNNIVSIQNVYYGGVEGSRNSGKSLQGYVKSLDASLDAKVVAAIDNALAKIDNMPAPFVNNFKDARNGEAVDACAELEEVLDEVIDAISNN